MSAKSKKSEQPRLPLTGWQIHLDDDAEEALRELRKTVELANRRIEEMVAFANRSHGQRMRWARAWGWA